MPYSSLRTLSLVMVIGLLGQTFPVSAYVVTTTSWGPTLDTNKLFVEDQKAMLLAKLGLQERPKPAALLGLTRTKDGYLLTFKGKPLGCDYFHRGPFYFNSQQAKLCCAYHTKTVSTVMKLFLRALKFSGAAVGGGVFGLAYSTTALAATSDDSHDDSKKIIESATTTYGDFPLKVPPEPIPVEERLTLPPVQIARKIESDADTSSLNMRLYQYQTCPFCSKVRVLMDYYGFNYEVVEVNPVTQQQIKFAGVRKVPFLVVQGEHNMPLRESSLVVSILRSFVNDPSKSIHALHSEYYPSIEIPVFDDANKDKVTGYKSKVPNLYFIMQPDESIDDKTVDYLAEERKWREWADDYFVHVLSPNVYRTPSEALETFRWFSQVAEWERLFPAWERVMTVYVGAAAMFFIGKRLKKRHSLKEDVRDTLYDYCRFWMKSVGPDRTFMGGERPNCADLAIYAMLTSISGTRAFTDALNHTNIGKWYYAVDKAVKERWGAKEFEANLNKNIVNSKSQSSWKSYIGL